MSTAGSSPDSQIGLVASIVVLALQILVRNKVLEERQRIEKHLLSDVKQIAPVEVHRHGVGFVEANDLHQIFGRIGQHCAACFEAMDNLGKLMRRGWEFGWAGRQDGCSHRSYSSEGFAAMLIRVE